MDPDLQETMASPPPRSPAKRFKMEHIPKATFAGDRKRGDKAPSGDDLHIEETPAISAFANVEDAFAGSHMTLPQEARKAALEQSRLDGYFGVQGPKDIEKDNSIRALSQHILTQRKRRLEDHRQEDEEAVVASSQQGEVQSEPEDREQGSQQSGDEVIPETQESVVD